MVVAVVMVRVLWAIVPYGSFFGFLAFWLFGSCLLGVQTSISDYSPRSRRA